MLNLLKSLEFNQTKKNNQNLSFVDLAFKTENFRFLKIYFQDIINIQKID
jgi:hypothetical protein